MKIKELKEEIKDLPDDADIMVHVFCCDEYFSGHSSPEEVYYDEEDKELVFTIET